jgi:hypothetical protein
MRVPTGRLRLKPCGIGYGVEGFMCSGRSNSVRSIGVLDQFQQVVPSPVATPSGNAVVSPAAPQASPNPPAEPLPAEHTSPITIEDDRAVTAALSGFQPVRQLEAKIVRVQP